MWVKTQKKKKTIKLINNLCARLWKALPRDKTQRSSLIIIIVQGRLVNLSPLVLGFLCALRALSFIGTLEFIDALVFIGVTCTSRGARRNTKLEPKLEIARGAAETFEWTKFGSLFLCGSRFRRIAHRELLESIPYFQYQWILSSSAKHRHTLRYHHWYYKIRTVSTPLLR